MLNSQTKSYCVVRSPDRLVCSLTCVGIPESKMHQPTTHASYMTYTHSLNGIHENSGVDQSICSRGEGCLLLVGCRWVHLSYAPPPIADSDRVLSQLVVSTQAAIGPPHRSAGPHINTYTRMYISKYDGSHNFKCDFASQYLTINEYRQWRVNTGLKLVYLLVYGQLGSSNAPSCVGQNKDKVVKGSL